MHPIEFPNQTVVFGASQPEYLPLPAHVARDFTVTTCWQLSLIERIKLLFTGKVWIQQLTFGTPLQPQRPDTKQPDMSTNCKINKRSENDNHGEGS